MDILLVLTGDTTVPFLDLHASHAQFFPCSVLVHSGGVHGGHYYAFIRPTLSDQWYVYVMESPFVLCSCNRMDNHACLCIQDFSNFRPFEKKAFQNFPISVFLPKTAQKVLVRVYLFWFVIFMCAENF